MAIEVERKFLVREIPPMGPGVIGRFISQGYLAIEPDGTEVRLRKEEGVLTVKTAGALARGEFEITLSSQDQIAELWPATEGRRVEKKRYEIPLQYGLTAELDIFQGSLEGLAMVEVEFPGLEDAQMFNPNVWFGPEVTNYPEFKNRSLATHGMLFGDIVLKSGDTISVPRHQQI